MGNQKINEDRARADDCNRPEQYQNHRKTKLKTIGNQHITQDRARADD